VISDKKILAIVPARAGSKGLPGKNVKSLLGKPLVGWSIDAGKNSKYIDDLIVSTDSEEIASQSREFGAEVPFIRPSEFSTDTASSIDVILHSVDWLAEHKRNYEIVVLLEPTSPLRETVDIDQAIELMHEHSATSVVSICCTESMHPMFMFHLNSNGILSPFSGNHPNNLRRQDINPIYFIDGTIYCSSIETLKFNRGFYHEKTYGYVVPKWKSLEIDDDDDFVMVEALMKARILRN
jgi:CMP-N,N'-diacetyllegionaminic acid synthase